MGERQQNRSKRERESERDLDVIQKGGRVETRGEDVWCQHDTIERNLSFGFGTL